MLILEKVWPALVSLFASHRYSFIKNYMLGGERERDSVMKLMYQPYLRIGIMHLAMIVGVLLILKFWQRVYLLVALVAIKIIIDLIAHLRKRRKAQKS